MPSVMLVPTASTAVVTVPAWSAGTVRGCTAGPKPQTKAARTAPRPAHSQSARRRLATSGEVSPDWRSTTASTTKATVGITTAFSPKPSARARTRVPETAYRARRPVRCSATASPQIHASAAWNGTAPTAIDQLSNAASASGENR